MTKARTNFTGNTYPDQNLKLLKVIGSGNWSEVYLAFNLKQTEKYAVKVISQHTLNETPRLKALIEGEKAILTQCNHPNVVKLHRHFVKDEHQFLVLQYCNGEDLGQLLQNEGTLSENTAVKYLFQILNGFKGLHSVNAMHRDFKVQNVMLHDDCCKIVDLGFGKQLSSLNEVTQTKLGSHLTMAPEVMQHLPYGIKADIWSIGVVFYQLLQGTYPFSGRNIEKILEKINKNEIVFNKADISEEAIDFIKRCLVVDPKGRIGWTEIYKHPLITKSKKIINNSELLSEKAQQNNSYYEKNNQKDILGPSPLYKILDETERHELKGNKVKSSKLPEDDIFGEVVPIKPIRQPQNSQYKDYSFADKGAERSQQQAKRNHYQAQLKQPQPKREDEQRKRKEKQSNKQKQQAKRSQQSANQDEIQVSQQSKKQVQPTEHSFKKIPKFTNPHDSHQINKTDSYESFMHDDFIKERVQQIAMKYMNKFQNIRFLPTLLQSRYKFLKQNIKEINHDYYLSLLWKDSYLKMQVLLEAINEKRNIFKFDQEVEIFYAYYQESHRHNLNQFMDSTKTEFEEMVAQAKTKQLPKDPLFDKQSKSIEQQADRTKPWKDFVCGIAEEYWMKLVEPKNNREGQSRQTLLKVIFCLSEFSTHNQTNTLSLKKVDKAINHFDVQKAEQNLEQKLQDRKWCRTAKEGQKSDRAVKKKEDRLQPAKFEAQKSTNPKRIQSSPKQYRNMQQNNLGKLNLNTRTQLYNLYTQKQLSYQYHNPRPPSTNPQKFNRSYKLSRK